MTIIYALILFALLIFPHELGHFLAAKSVGVKVNEFAFGMGPALFKRQKGETLYSIRLIPIGGYCAMEGEDEDSEDSRAFNKKPGWAKIYVLLAGSAMNVLIAVLVLSLMMGIIGSPTTSIGEIEKGSPAARAGLEAGDKVLSVNGHDIDKWQDIAGAVKDGGKETSLTVQRGKEKLSVRTVPVKQEDGRFVIGISTELSHNVFTAVSNGAQATWNLTKVMFKSIEMLFTGDASAKDISGPVGMVSLVSQTNQYGLTYFAYLIALISLNLALINMLPLPALDGGRILFVFIRKITGRMISDDLEGKIHAAGLILLFAVMIFVTWNDIVRLFTS